MLCTWPMPVQMTRPNSLRKGNNLQGQDLWCAARVCSVFTTTTELSVGHFVGSNIRFLWANELSSHDTLNLIPTLDHHFYPNIYRNRKKHLTEYNRTKFKKSMDRRLVVVVASKFGWMDGIDIANVLGTMFRMSKLIDGLFCFSFSG